MKAITIKQPWASLIASGIKKYEFRSWPTKHRGPIYIHAGMTMESKYLPLLLSLNLEYPKGAIIAKANLVDCILIDEKFNKKINKEKNIAYSAWTDRVGYYAWVLEDIEVIEPVYVKGKLSLWEYEDKS